MNHSAFAPAVSVIVPTFNRSALLSQTLECLKNQTLHASEFLLIDDGSGSEAVSELERACRDDPRFLVVAKPQCLPKGCQSSKNHALTVARGRYVVFLDSDDLLSPQCLERRCQFLDEYPSVDIAVGEQAVLFEQSDEVKWVNCATRAGVDLDRFLNLTHPLDIPWVNGAVAIRVSSLRGKGLGYRPEFRWEDAAFHIECLTSALRTAWLPRTGFPDSFYRIHGTTMGSDLWTGDGIRNCAQMLLWIRDLLEKHELLNELRSSVLARNFFHLAILRAVDSRDMILARESLTLGHSLFSPIMFSYLQGFCFRRSLMRWSSRLTWHVNQGIHRRFPQLFPLGGETWGKGQCDKLPNLEAVRNFFPFYRKACETLDGN